MTGPARTGPALTGPAAPGERIGVFGGTFDPVHIGHLVAAVNVRHALGLDRMLLVVAGEPWQKAGRVVAPAEDRFALVSAAVAGIDGLEASRLELDRAGESVTADTLERLAAEVPGRALFLVVGADVAAELGTWRRVDVVRRLATLVVVDRPGAAPAAAPGPALAPATLGPGWRVERVAIPRIELSSSDLRARAATGLPLDLLLPAAAIALIRERGLYAGAG